MASLQLTGPGLTLHFTQTGEHLALSQIQRRDAAPLLYRDPAGTQPGSGPVGNPLAVVIPAGPQAGIHGMDRFRVTQLSHTERRLLAYLRHEALPLELVLEVEVEGHVATWRGQVIWNGPEPLELDVYYPMLSRLRFDPAGQDRTLMPQISGSVLAVADLNFRRAYLGNLSCPLFLVEGAGRGLAVLDDNRADLAADPGACALRSYTVGHTFPVPPDRPVRWDPAQNVVGGPDGVFVGVCHTRRLAAAEAGRPVANQTAERQTVTLPAVVRGDAVDLGPVRMYAYHGTWKEGAAWLRTQRRHVPFRTSPAGWYQRTTFLSEDMGDDMLKRGQSFHDYPKLLAQKQALGSDLFHLPGFHDPEVLGTPHNWLNRGDYFFAAQNLGGFEAVRQGVEALHRAGGHLLYYVEGLIMWKRSRIGRTQGRDWALMKADGTYDEHYQGFWHMCPACAGWRTWLADTCAQIVRTTGIDGFFIDSTCATHNHRCFNPAHRHPHPDVWNWGVRQMLREVRQAVDQVDPATILVVEGEGDLAREFADGFVTHGHDWTGWTLHEPLVRFLHPQMRAFESWASRQAAPVDRPIEWLHVWNSVVGHRIYAHGPHADEMAAWSHRTRRYYDAFPEICDAPLSQRDVEARHCMACLFDAMPVVLTVGNLSSQPVQAQVRLPVPGGMLFDRVDGLRVPVVDGEAALTLPPWEFRAFEVRA
jgi:hypothetical protein